MRLSVYESILIYFLQDLEEEEIKRVVGGWVEEWIRIKKGGIITTHEHLLKIGY